MEKQNEQFDLGWVVAILEGEGCFGAYSDSRHPSTFYVKVQMESTDYDTVMHLNSLVPGRVWESTYPSRTKRFKNVKRSWRWALSDKESVKELCIKVYPYMSERRKQQIEFVLSHCEYKRKPRSKCKNDE